MYRIVYTVTVLSEEPIPGGADFKEVLAEADTGEYVADVSESGEEELTGKQMADALINAGSDPAFFSLDREGNKIND